MTAKEEDAKNELASILMQRMAAHAPVTQNSTVSRGMGLRWNILWGKHIGAQADTRFEAVMLIIQNLFEEAKSDVDPRMAPADDPGELEEGSLDANKLDPQAGDDSDKA